MGTVSGEWASTKVISLAKRAHMSGGRSCNGSDIVEMPLVLLVLFMFLAFPMINLATATVRAYLIRSIVTDAAHKGARACTFRTPVPQGANAEDEPGCDSAINLAESELADFVNNPANQKFPGISIEVPKYFVYYKNVNSGSWKRSADKQPLAPSEIDETNCRYYFEISATGHANPLINMSGTMVPQVPGLSSPVDVSVEARELFEQVQGLAQ